MIDHLNCNRCGYKQYDEETIRNHIYFVGDEDDYLCAACLDNPEDGEFLEPRFRVGQVVLYSNGDRHEIGVIKETLCTQTTCKYSVFYHTGSTTAVTDESLLAPFSNEYAYLIVRQGVNPEYEDNPLKQLAHDIYNNLDSYDYEESILKTLEKWAR